MNVKAWKRARRICATTAVTFGLAVGMVGCGTQSTAAGGASDSAKSGTSSAGKDDFPNKTISLVVPYAPGGDFDTTARLLAPFLTKYLPNKPAVIVKNVPGGNSEIGDMQVIDADPDGYTIGYFTLPGIALGPLIGQGNYDLTKVSWIGQVFSMPYVAAVSKKSGLKDIAAVKADPHLKIGTTGITTTAGLASFITTKVLGLQNSSTVPSGGSSMSILAASQGAVDFVQFPYSALQQQIKAGLIAPLWVNSSKRLPELPQVPTIAELGYPQLASVVSLSGALGTAPGVPPQDVAILQDALRKALSDPDFIAKMKAANESPAYLNGADTLTEVKNDIQVMKTYAPQIKAAINK
ncbi:Bug family tripartite tricarboxylate transporter substrate binding protein [Alicyclobacillus fastidiosus]|uniref:Tripartite tricarboxylate transporter substrate binding protein n=1 Tax=Alicyclobacillus fastidiosus TaxID=392011 RepID=A0ABV5AAC8_9BACL|nr:tripartite tricarboxylate transporter substrate binding protein [Alicyclobacillus fastidiosus]WEH07697.1 tripartite tricarboxylate transporter substrate binding protein [Alicyclobacillus fastidiosus]